MNMPCVEKRRYEALRAEDWRLTAAVPFTDMAPEMIQSTAGYDGKQADVWSCGIMLYVCVQGGGKRPEGRGGCGANQMEQCLLLSMPAGSRQQLMHHPQFSQHLSSQIITLHHLFKFSPATHLSPQIMLFGCYPFDPDTAAAPPPLGGVGGSLPMDVSLQGSAERMISRIMSLQV